MQIFKLELFIFHFCVLQYVDLVFQHMFLALRNSAEIHDDHRLGLFGLVGLIWCHHSQRDFE